MGKREKRKNSGTKILVIILCLVIIVAGGVLAYKAIKDKEKIDIPVADVEEPKQEIGRAHV